MDNPLSSFKNLQRATEIFIRNNTVIESSQPIDVAVEEMNQCSNINNLFQLPIQHRLMTLDTSLQWVLFLSASPNMAKEHGDEVYSPSNAFNVKFAIDLIINVFDLATQRNIFDLFDESDSSDSSSDEEEEAKE